MDKFIGILGGMGTEATLRFYHELLVFDRPDSDQGYLKVLLYNNSKIPDRTHYILNRENSPLEALIASARTLQDSGVDFVVMPCNTAHYFYDQIKASLKIPIVDMIKEVALEVKLNHAKKKRIGLLATTGTIKSDVYQKKFKAYDLDIIYPNEDEQTTVNEIIYHIKMKKELDLKLFNETVSAFYNQNHLDLLILGCTEFSLIKNKINIDESAIIDSNLLLAYRTYLYGKNKTNIEK